MKRTYLKLTFILTALFMLGASAIHAQNSLKVANVTAGPGEKSNISIELNNTDQVVGFQFTLTVPQGLIVSEKAVELTSRKGDQVVYPQKVSATQYMFLCFSLSNDFFKGNSGTLLNIPIELPIGYQPGTTYPLTLSGVILSSAAGTDIGSNHQNGTLTVGAAQTPDLQVSGVNVSETEISPNGTISVSWGVKNIGNAGASGTWTEQVSLVSTLTGDRYLLGNVSYTGSLAMNETISRNGKFNIPKIPGMDGEVKVEVNLVPGATIVELETAKANNKALSANSATLKKLLYLSFNQSQVDENATTPVSATLTMSGNRSVAQTFQLSCSASDQLTFPATITIGQNQSAVAFDILPVNNNIADGNRTLSLTASGNNYPDASQEITIIDDEIGTVTLMSSKYSVTDGDQITVTLTTDRTRTKDATFTLTADQPARWNVPASILLPAGSQTVTFPVGIKTFSTPEPTVTGKITAKAEGYKSGTVEISIVSANIPAFEFTIDPNAISEGDGVYATYAVIKRLDKPEVAVTLNLKPDKTGMLILPTSINFPAGVSQQKFNIGVIDNDMVDGTRVVNIMASIYLPSCNCTTGAGTGGTELSRTVTIFDNDGLALSVKANPSTVKAGLTNAAIITISRNTTDLSNPFNVRLSVNEPTIVSIPATAVIPAGQKSVDVNINTVIDPSKVGDQTVRIQAEADNYTSGFGWILVSDQNKPDPAVTNVTVSSPLSGGGDAEVRITVANQGYTTLAKGTKVEYYLSKSNTIQNGVLLATSELDNDINAGSILEFVRTIQLPDKAGDYFMIVVLNSNRKIDELSSANNQMGTPVQLSPTYTASVSVDKPVYKSEETVTISGTAKFANNNPAANKKIEVIISNNSGFVRTDSTVTNESGAYKYSFQPLPGENGHYTASAGYPGASNNAKAEFDIAGFEWKNKPSPYLIWEVIEFSTKTGEFVLKNNTNVQLSNVKIVLPEDVDFTIQSAPINIAAGGTGTLSYTITPKGPTQGRDYVKIPVSLVSDEGARLDFLGWYYCHPQTAKLTPNPVAINTTMTKGSARFYEITLINGAVEAKDVSINIPSIDWMSLVSPQKIPVVAPYDTVKVILQLKPTDQQQLNVPISGTIGVKISNGAGFQIPFKIETVSEATGSVQVDVTDDYTYNTASAPHLAGANVIIRHPFSGAIIAQGVTNSAGLFNADNIPEGYYTLSVSADKHNNYQNTILIDPGKVNNLTAFLSYQAISFTWDVVPTEIEDKYQTDIIVKFETNVPRPVVVFDFDKTPIDLQPGESKMLDITVTNYGLIAAFDVNIQTPVAEGYTFKLLADYFPALNAKSSVTVPLLIQKNSAGLRSSDGSCVTAIITGIYRIICGPEGYEDNIRGKLPLLPAPDCSLPIIILPPPPPPGKGTDGPGGPGDCFDCPCLDCGGDGTIGGSGVSVGIEVNCNLGPSKASADNSRSTLRQAEATNSNSVCATVTVKFSQTITMTREAFEGTLTLNNGGAAGALTDVNLDLMVTDENGQDATYLFQVNKDAFLSGTGSVGSGNSQAGTVIFIPTKQAAPTVPLSYSFGGTLSYTDPGLGEKVTVKLYPVTLQVNPSPDLVLHYFMQRDILGDDPLTEDVVEPSIPAELALMIQNEGYGTAKNVSVESMQPQIVDNQKGLVIDFNIVGSNFNNEPKQLGLLNVNFGNIEPQKSAIGQWWFTSTLMGHFVDYQINVTHLSSFGNKNLSLIKDYQLHELIRSVKAYGAGHDNIGDFLVNDIPDKDDTPDEIYYSNGGKDNVYVAQDASVSNPISSSNLTAKLSVTPYMMGWNYGHIKDPGGKEYQLVKAVRNSDNLELPKENFWQTYVTMRQGSEPKYENNLHFLDKITAAENYTLYYAPKDTVYPKVVAFENVPADAATQPVENILVKFNRPIDVNTFTTNDIQLIYQGNHVSTDNILIGKVDSVTYALNLQAVTTASGYYELTVQCAGIKDLLGNEGQTGKSTKWIQVMGELAVLSFTTDQVKSQPVNSVAILFNKTVAPNQFTKDKITLNGEPLGENVSILTDDNLHYTIAGLSAYNNLSGSYELSVDMPAIKSENNIQGLIAQSCKWNVDVVMPAVKYFTSHFQGAVNNQNITDMQVTLTKPVVNGLETNRITLYRGSVNLNAALNVTKMDSLNYLISGLGSYTQTSGGYKLSIDQSNFVDAFGNYGTGQVDTMWIVSLVKPAMATNLKLTPDRGVSNADNITSGNDLSISFTTNAAQLTVALYAVFPQGETLIKEQYVENAGVVTIPVTGYSGKMTFKVVTYDVYGNESNPASIEAFIDNQNLGAEIIPVKGAGSGCPDELNYVSIRFTDDINATEFTKDALSLNAAGTLLPVDNIVITRISDNEFKVEKFDNIQNNGDITIGVNMEMLHKKSSGLQGKGVISQNIGNVNVYSMQISGDNAVTINDISTYTASPGMLNYLWNVTGGTIAASGLNSISVRWNTLGNQTITLTYTTPNNCVKTVSKTVQVKANKAMVIAWQGGTDSDWDNYLNWENGLIPAKTDIVVIPSVANHFPVLTASVEVAEIHFEPGAEIGNQHYLEGKAFVQYDLSEPKRWHMLSVPLGQVYPGDFTFGGYPVTWVRTFQTSQSTAESGSLTTGTWVTARGNTDKFTYGDGFVLWLNEDNSTVDKGLKLLNGIRELPFFFHHAAESPDKALYDKVHQAHDYDAVTKNSTFYNYELKNGEYVRMANTHYSVARNDSAYLLAKEPVYKVLDFGTNSEAGGEVAIVGNPYMATLDFEALHAANTGSVKPCYQVWTGNEGYAAYSIFGYAGSVGQGIEPLNQYIAPLQAFLVERPEAPISGSLSFTEAMATASAGASLRSSVNSENKLDIIAGNPAGAVLTFIAKREGGQDTFGDLDVRKIINGISDIPEVYTLKLYKNGSIATSVNIINSDNCLIPVGLATSYTGNITLSFSGMDAYDANLSLIDAVANKEIDLTGLVSYDYAVNYTPVKVNGAAAACEDRFFIRISKTLTGMKETIAGKVNVYELNKRIHVVSGVGNLIKEVMVYDLQGVLAYKANAIGAISHTVELNFPAGVYIVRVISEKNIDNVKLIIH